MVEGKGIAILIIAIIVFLAMSLITVSLRLVVRLFIVKAFGWDDGLMLVAMVLNLGFSLCGIIGTFHGIGQKNNLFATKPSVYRTAMLCWWLAELFYVTTTVMVKFSIIVTLLRIVFERVHRWVLYITAVVSMLFGLLLFIFFIFQCHPISAFWDNGRMDTCTNTNIAVIIVYSFSAGEALTDLIIGILPWFVIWRLNMDRRERIALAGILGIGGIASAAVIVRFPFVHHWNNPDLPYAISEVWILSYIESGLGITAGSLVTLWPLFNRPNKGRGTLNSLECHTYHSSDLPPLNSNCEDGENLDYHIFLQEEARHRY